MREAGAVILPDEAEDGGVQADGGHEHDLLDARGDAARGDGLFTEVFHEPGDDENAERNGEHVEHRGHALRQDAAQRGGVGAEVTPRQRATEFRGNDMPRKPSAASHLDDDGGERDARHTHRRQTEPAPHEHGIEQAVGEEARDEKIAIHPRVALRAEHGVEGHGKEKEHAAREDHIHVGEHRAEVVALRSEQAKHPRRRQPARDGNARADEEGEHERLRKDAPRILALARAEGVGDQRRRALAEPAAGRDDDEEHRKRERQRSQRIRAQQPRAVGVHEVVHRVEKHPDARRDGDAPDELRDRIGGERKRAAHEVSDLRRLRGECERSAHGGCPWVRPPARASQRHPSVRTADVGSGGRFSSQERRRRRAGHRPPPRIRQPLRT